MGVVLSWMMSYNWSTLPNLLFLLSFLPKKMNQVRFGRALKRRIIPPLIRKGEKELTKMQYRKLYAVFDYMSRLNTNLTKKKKQLLTKTRKSLAVKMRIRIGKHRVVTSKSNAEKKFERLISLIDTMLYVTRNFIASPVERFCMLKMIDIVTAEDFSKAMRLLEMQFVEGFYDCVYKGSIMWDFSLGSDLFGYKKQVDDLSIRRRQLKAILKKGSA